MLSNLPTLILVLTALVHASPGKESQTYTCDEFFVDLSVSAQVVALNTIPPRNQSELTGIITRFVSQTSNVTAETVGGPKTLNGSYKIWSQLCVPSGFPSSGGVLEFAIHGINFDHSYWNFGGKGSKYNYVESAIKSGRAVFSYDRLGTGKSSKPDGIKEVQRGTEVEIAAALVNIIKTGRNGFSFQKVIGVGHSFGSSQLVGIVEKYGNLFDAIVLTGFSSYLGGLSMTTTGFSLTIASQQNPARFGSLNSAYLATSGIINDQQDFFHYPYFEYSALQLAEKTKETVTIGELFTLIPNPAQNYTNPVFVVTGDKDFIYCGGNCYQSTDGTNNLIESTNVLLPSSSNFSTYIPANTGHAVNIHDSTPTTYTVIESWINKVL